MDVFVDTKHGRDSCDMPEVLHDHCNSVAVLDGKFKEKVP